MAFRAFIFISLFLAQFAYGASKCKKQFAVSPQLQTSLDDVNARTEEYLEQTGAKSRRMSFPVAPGKLELGPEKLVVAVSAASWDKFAELVLSNKNSMTVLGHAAVITGGKFYGHGGGPATELRAGGLGTPYPILVLTSSESTRLSRYMKLAMEPSYRGWQHALKIPWMLPGYLSAQGGYTCCTHWIGNIPIGDNLVTEYSFPTRDDNAPVTAQISDYVVPQGHEELAKVWTSPGHEQLADVIGQGDANRRGEFASPGFVIHTLLGPTEATRVPVVFVMVADHTLDLDPNPNLSFERPY